MQSCLFHIIHKGRYIASNCSSAFFRAEHNASEMEAYCNALRQLRALLHLAQQLLHDNAHGELSSLQDRDLSRRFVHEYSSMHKACFYGRCLGFQVRPGKQPPPPPGSGRSGPAHSLVLVPPQFSPALRPFLQTVVISMVSYGEMYGKQQSGLGGSRAAASGGRAAVALADRLLLQGRRRSPCSPRPSTSSTRSCGGPSLSASLRTWT